MTEELEACPFCGCEVEIRIGYTNQYYIIHPESDCIMCGYASYYYDDKNELINEWNERMKE